ncbi:MAG: sulfatase [Eubacteriales bacterium]
MEKRPNILYIMSDDHAANGISAYDSRLKEVMETTNIDRLAKEGGMLKQCFCTNALCTPSRATILTGRYSHETGVRVLSDTMDTNEITYPRLMQAAGYQTAVIGKWHLHSEPQGFDYYSIFPSQGSYWNPWFMETGFDWSDICTHKQNDLGTHETGYVTDIVTDKSLKWLEERDKDKPFMLMCQHKAPHDNFEYHPRYEHIFDGVEIPEPDTLWEDHALRSEATRDRGTSVSERSKVRSYVKLFENPSDWCTGGIDMEGMTSTEKTKVAYQKYLKDYLRTVKGIDDNVGRLLDYLEAEGELDNTVIIYTSDQGMILGEHDFIDKRWIYEESIQMPFLIRYPKEIKPGTVVESIIANYDYAATLLDYTEIEKPECMHGHSFRGLLNGSSDAPINDSIYYRYWVHLTHHDNPAHYGIRTQKYKLIFFYGLSLDAGSDNPPSTPGWELFDLEKDPYETTNVYDDLAYKEIAIALTKQLDATKEALGDTDERYPELIAVRQQCLGVMA